MLSLDLLKGRLTLTDAAAGDGSSNTNSKPAA